MLAWQLRNHTEIKIQLEATPGSPYNCDCMHHFIHVKDHCNNYRQLTTNNSNYIDFHPVKFSTGETISYIAHVVQVTIQLNIQSKAFFICRIEQHIDFIGSDWNSVILVSFFSFFSHQSRAAISLFLLRFHWSIRSQHSARDSFMAMNVLFRAENAA